MKEKIKDKLDAGEREQKVDLEKKTLWRQNKRVKVNKGNTRRIRIKRVREKGQG